MAHTQPPAGTVHFREHSITGEQLGVLVREVVAQSEDTRYVEQWDDDGNVVCFGQASTAYPAAHLRLAPSHTTQHFWPEGKYSKVKILSHFWVEPTAAENPNNREPAAPKPVRSMLAPRLVWAAIKQFEANLGKAYEAACQAGRFI